MNRSGACVAHLLLKASGHTQTCSTTEPRQWINCCLSLPAARGAWQAGTVRSASQPCAGYFGKGWPQTIVCVGSVRGKVDSAETSGVAPCPRHLSTPSHLSPLQSHWTKPYGPGLGPSYTINAGGSSRPGCVRPKQQKKTSLPPKKPALSHGAPPSGRISARWNTDTTDIQTTHLYTEWVPSSFYHLLQQLCRAVIHWPNPEHPPTPELQRWDPLRFHTGELF